MEEKARAGGSLSWYSLARTPGLTLVRLPLSQALGASPNPRPHSSSMDLFHFLKDERERGGRERERETAKRQSETAWRKRQRGRPKEDRHNVTEAWCCAGQPGGDSCAPEHRLTGQVRPRGRNPLFFLKKDPLSRVA